jgi:hypothetical protein
VKVSEDFGIDPKIPDQIESFAQFPRERDSEGKVVQRSEFIILRSF